MSHPDADPVQGRQEVARVGARGQGRDPARHRAAHRLTRRPRARLSRAVTPAQTRSVRIYRLGDEGPRSATSSGAWRRSAPHVDAAELGGAFGPRPRRPSARSSSGATCSSTARVGPDTWGELVEAGYRSATGSCTCDSRQLPRRRRARAPAPAERSWASTRGARTASSGPTPTAPSASSSGTSGYEPDGIAGPHAIATLERMRPQEAGPSRALVREDEELRQARASIEGTVVGRRSRPSGRGRRGHVRDGDNPARRARRAGRETGPRMRPRRGPDRVRAGARRERAGRVRLRVVTPGRRTARGCRPHLLLLRQRVHPFARGDAAGAADPGRARGRAGRPGPAAPPHRRAPA